MKKTFVISGSVLFLCSLGAYGFMQWNDTGCSTASHGQGSPVPFHQVLNAYAFPMNTPEFAFDVNPRFQATVTKEQLRNATQIADLLPSRATDGLSAFSEVEIHRLDPEVDIKEIGRNEALNPAQLTLLHSLDYADNFYITAKCKQSNVRNSQLEDYDFVYYVSVIPETPARHSYGQDGLVYHLKEYSKSVVQEADMRTIQPGKLKFTINRDGNLSNIHLESSCGTEKIDRAMMEALKKVPGTWEPALNEKGEKVEQELIFSFGVAGC